jgi:uncharacterized protein YndB with AHSA1/START domain
MAEPFRAGIHVDAPPERVFAYFTDADAMVAWMGDRARLVPVPGGEFAVDVRGVGVRGRYVAVEPPHRLVFSWGHEGSAELPPGASTVEVRLRAANGGTNVVIEHRDLPPARAPGHARGWRMFLGRLAGTAASGRAIAVPPEPCDPGATADS